MKVSSIVHPYIVSLLQMLTSSFGQCGVCSYASSMLNSMRAYSSAVLAYMQV